MSIPPENPHAYPTAPPPVVMGQPYQAQQQPPPQQQQQQASSPKPAVYTQPPPAMIYMPCFGDDPVRLTCPSCRATVITNVQHNMSCGTWLCVLLVFLIFWPLAWLPCCIDSCKQADHSCPNCGCRVGRKVFITS